MATKQFKIGEYAVGGIIKVTTNGNCISIQSVDYYSKEVIGNYEFDSASNNAEREVDNLLNELTSSYYSDLVMKWIKEHVRFNEKGWHSW
jgi:hypothetical protein